MHNYLVYATNALRASRLAQQDNDTKSAAILANLAFVHSHRVDLPLRSELRGNIVDACTDTFYDLTADMGATEARTYVSQALIGPICDQITPYMDRARVEDEA